jgi:hypothetical protein
LIQLLKSVSIKSFVSTEAAHSTAAFLTVKLFFENLFSTQPLAASATWSLQRGAHSTAPHLTVKLYFENFFSFQQLTAFENLAPRQRGAHST